MAGQSTGGNLAVELSYRAPGSVAGAVGVDGGVLELREQWPEWDDCREALAPPDFAGTPLPRIESQLRESHPDWSDQGIAATLANFEVRPDGTVRPWLTLDRHIRVLRALWEHRPSRLLPLLEVPLLLVLAHSRDQGMDAKRRGGERAVATAGRGARVEWLTGDHDLHVQHPKMVAEILAAAVAGGFFPP